MRAAGVTKFSSNSVKLGMKLNKISVFLERNISSCYGEKAGGINYAHVLAYD
jgi:hypothetical protein